MIPAALWLVILPLGAIPPVYLLRRFRLGAITTVGVALAMAWLVLRLPAGPILNVLGRSIEIDALSQSTLVLLFVAAAVLFLIPALSPRYVRAGRHSFVTGQEERIFYPVGLAVLAMLVGASLSRHLGITAMFVEAAAILSVFIIQGERLDSTRAALRFLILMSLATPLFLLAAWQIDRYHLGSGSGSAGQATQTIFFVTAGFSLWLAITPFHGWPIAAAAESAPATAAFTIIAFPLIAFSTLVHLLRELPWLVSSPQLVQAIIVAGLVTVLVGGVLAAVQRGFSQLMGYSALYNLGLGLVIVGVGGPATVLTLLVTLSVRILGLALTAAGISVLRGLVAGDGFVQVRGIVRQAPIAVIGLVVGGFTLAGAPLTAGFAPQWQVFRSLAELNLVWPVLLAAGSLGVVAGYLRGLRAVLSLPLTSPRQAGQRRGLSIMFAESPLLAAVISFLVVLALAMGVFPALLIDLFRPVAASIPFPIG